MRKVNRNLFAKPVELSSVNCLAHVNNIINSIANKAEPKVSPKYYKGEKINADGTVEFTVRETLKKLYLNKCAYCEKYAYKPKIDHHRPHGRVQGENAQNKGYYWLYCEWSNLLPSCTDCNSIEAKGAKFPIIGKRKETHPKTGNPSRTDFIHFVYNAGYNTEEDPLLLHPEYCIPINNFDFDKRGKIFGKNRKGRETVSAIKLDNDDLNGWREKIYLDNLANLEKIVVRHFRALNPTSEDIFEDELSDWVLKLAIDANNESLEYTLFRTTIFKKLDYFFIDELAFEFRNKVKNKIAEVLILLSK